MQGGLDECRFTDMFLLDMLHYPRLHSSKYVNNIYTIRDFAPSEEGRENAFDFACSFVMQYLPYFDDG